VYKPLKSVTHGQCDARPMVTFPAAEHHRLLTDRMKKTKMNFFLVIWCLLNAKMQFFPSSEMKRLKSGTFTNYWISVCWQHAICSFFGCHRNIFSGKDGSLSAEKLACTLDDDDDELKLKPSLSAANYDW